MNPMRPILSGEIRSAVRSLDQSVFGSIGITRSLGRAQLDPYIGAGGLTATAHIGDPQGELIPRTHLRVVFQRNSSSHVDRYHSSERGAHPLDWSEPAIDDKA